MKLRILCLVSMVFGLWMAAGCKVETPEPFTYSHSLGGKDIPADTLTDGREQYTLYCYACHGNAGDGRGPASAYLRPAPRDFRQSLFKFTKNEDGTLPSDEVILALLKRGLHGSAMLPWEDIPEVTLKNIVQYMKTFAPDCDGPNCLETGWRDKESKVANQVEVGCNPFGDEDANSNGKLDDGEDCNENGNLDAARPGDAIAVGESLYHGKDLSCQKCHAAYITRSEIEKLGGDQTKPTYYAKPQKSQYSVPVPGHPTVNCREELTCDRAFFTQVDRWSCVQPRTCVGGPYDRSSCKTNEHCTEDATGEAGVCTAGGLGTCQECVDFTDCGGEKCATVKDGKFDGISQVDANAICAARYNSDSFKCAKDGHCTDSADGRPVDVGKNCDDESPSTCNRRICRYGVCEQMDWITPREFENGKFRGGGELEDLYRTIKAGLGGTQMSSQTKDNHQLWALAHYVRHLASVNASPLARKERRARLEQSEFATPAEAPEK